MGACLSNEKLPENVFIVRNIHDDHRRFPKGIIEVTSVELKYKDAKSGDEWVWPLKYLRKYGCDRDIFSFEAGRKCPGGEGLYAFSTKKASQLFDIVARNISEEGGIEGEAGTLSPSDGSNLPSHSPESLVSPPVPTNPPPVPTSDPPTHPPPSVQYQNMSYQDGQPFLTNGNGELVQPAHPPPPLPSLLEEHTASATPSPPPRVNYAEVSLLEPSDTTLPIEGDTEKRVSYSQIDIKQTEEYNLQMAKLQAESLPPLPNLGTGEFKIVTPSERKGRGVSSSRLSPSAPDSPSSSSSVATRTLSDGNFATSSKKSTSGTRGNGSVPGRSHSLSMPSMPDSMYQNISISKKSPAPAIPELNESDSASPPPQQQQEVNYMNITPKSSIAHTNNTPQPSAGSRRDSELNKLHPPKDSDLKMYENLRLGKGVTSPPINLHHHAASPPRVGGAAMALYADLELKPSTTSTPKPSRTDRDEDSHMVFSFASGQSPVIKTATPINRSLTATSASPPPTDLQMPERGRSASELPPQSSVDTVNYAAMDFTIMEALRKTKEEREEEIRQRTEEEAREEERKKKEEAERLANPGKSKKGKKGKKKDRRNSHQ